MMGGDVRIDRYRLSSLGLDYKATPANLCPLIVKYNKSVDLLMLITALSIFNRRVRHCSSLFVTVPNSSELLFLNFNAILHLLKKKYKVL